MTATWSVASWNSAAGFEARANRDRGRAYNRVGSYHIQVMIRVLAIGLLSLLLVSACTPFQKYELTDTTRGNETVYVDPETIDKAQRVKLANSLTAAGYVVASARQDADLIAKLVFSVGEGERRESFIEVPEYERVREVHFINGRQRIFTEERFVGYRRERIIETIYPTVAVIVLEEDSRQRRFRSVETEGTCGSAAILKPALLEVLLSGKTPVSGTIELPDC